MMKNCRLLSLLITAALSVIIPVFAGAAESSNNGGVDFNIRFYDRRIYHVETDPVYIQVTVTNNSPSTYRFKLADERVFSLDFDVRTATNRPLEPADSLVGKRTRQQQVFFREIAVETGESFSFVEDLRSYVRLNEPGAFVVKAAIYPELLRSGSAEKLESERLSLNIRPPVITDAAGIPVAMDDATGAALVREKLPPDQVVEYTLSARQKSQWEKFYLYLDLEAMLSRDAVRQRKWINESEEGRRRMTEEFRRELRNSTADGTISVIPDEFVTERTQYSGLEGTVTVLEKFRHSNYTELKRYTYYLTLKDNIWTITDYSVINLGTE